MVSRDRVKFGVGKSAEGEGCSLAAVNRIYEAIIYYTVLLKDICFDFVMKFDVLLNQNLPSP